MAYKARARYVGRGGLAERTHHHVEIPAVLAARAVCDVDDREETLVVALESE